MGRKWQPQAGLRPANPEKSPLARSPRMAKKKVARIPRRERGPPAHWLPGVEEFTSSFFFRWPPPKLKRLRFGLRSSGFYPQMVCSHPVHQRERCKSAESRINLLLGTPPRYCDVDGTRDWSRLSNTKTINSRVGDDSIKRDFRERKRGICYPQSCTFLTFPHFNLSEPCSRSVFICGRFFSVAGRSPHPAARGRPT